MSGDDFNRFAKIYDRFIHRRAAISWVGLLKSNPQQYIFDLGGGTGRLVEHYLEAAERVLIFDLSFDMLRVSQFANHARVDRVCCDLHHLPFKSAQDGHYVMVDALHHIFEPKPIVQDVANRLAAGSLFLIEEPNFEKFSIKILALLE